MCFIFITNNGIDICLYDRKIEFNNNNLSLCEANCDYEGYIFETKMALCNCSIKNEMPLISEIIWNKNDLLKSDIKRKVMNVEVMKCYYILFSKDGLIKNFVSYIILSIIFINIVFAVLFCIKGYDKLNLEIKKIILNKKNTNEIKENYRENNPQKKIKIKKKNQLPPLQNQINRRKINTKNMNYNENEISSKLDFKLNNNGGVTDIKIYPNLQSKNNKIIFNNQELNNLEYKEANMIKEIFVNFIFLY